MSTPFLGQVTIFGFGYAPKGWAACNGQLMPINQNQALFSLLGTQFGGDGIRTFALPNLQGSFELCQGSGFVIGQAGGEVAHTLIANEVPSHTHLMAASSASASAATPVNNFPAMPASGANIFGTGLSTQLGPASTAGGGSQPHPNMPPFLVLNICIALTGIFPSRN